MDLDDVRSIAAGDLPLAVHTIWSNLLRVAAFLVSEGE